MAKDRRFYESDWDYYDALEADEVEERDEFDWFEAE